MSFLLMTVLYLMMVLVVVAVIVFVDRMLRLRKISIDPQDFLPGVFAVLDNGQQQEALAICDETPGPVSALVAVAIEHQSAAEINIREILAATAHGELSRLERRAQLLSLFAQLLPLLGLLGTFMGGYLALRGINTALPLVEANSVLGAAGKGLLTTIIGLIGATGCYVGHHLVLVRVNALSLAMDTTVALVLDYFARKVPGHE